MRGVTAPAPGSSLTTIGSEIAAVLAQVSSDDLAAARDFLSDRPGRWFVMGQGRSSLIGQMAAMRLMHLGRPSHVVGEATAPAVGDGDHVIAISGSGETAVTLHLAQLASRAGADLLAVTTRSNSALGALSNVTLGVPATGSSQFGGSLFEQCALLVLDAVVLELTAGDADVYRAMGRRHTNLQ